MTATATRPSTQEPADRLPRPRPACTSLPKFSSSAFANAESNVAEITLHVGLASLQPVRVEKVEDHKLHRESYEISPATAQSINKAKSEHRRVVAVGTTTVRTLEHSAAQLDAHRSRVASALIAPGRGEADALIYPGYRFRVVDALLTNFHLPQSTLLMLVCALGGQRQVLQAYRHAVNAGYRFDSYGDCMFVE